MSEYLDQIIFWIGSAIAALGGTGISLGILFKSISGVIKALKKNINGYDEQIEKIEKLGKTLQEDGETVLSIATKLQVVTEQLEEQKKINDKLSTDYSKIQQVLYIMAHNNKELADCGALKYLDEVLDIQKEEKVSEV